jgi:hypothetical protein
MCSSDSIVSVLSVNGLPLGTAAAVGATPLSVGSRLRAAAHLAFISYSSLFFRSPCSHPSCGHDNRRSGNHGLRLPGKSQATRVPVGQRASRMNAIDSDTPPLLYDEEPCLVAPLARGNGPPGQAFTPVDLSVPPPFQFDPGFLLRWARSERKSE